MREATDEYVKSENERFGELCQLLQPDALDEEIAAVIATGLGSKKGVLVIEAQRYENEFAAKTEVIEEFCVYGPSRSLESIHLRVTILRTDTLWVQMELRTTKLTTTIVTTKRRTIILKL